MPKIVKQPKKETKSANETVKVAKEAVPVEQVEDKGLQQVDPPKKKETALQEPCNIVEKMLGQYFKIEQHEKEETIVDTYNRHKEKFAALCEIETLIAEHRSSYIQAMQELHVQFKKIDGNEVVVNDANNDADVDPDLEKDAHGDVKKGKKVADTKTVKKQAKKVEPEEPEEPDEADDAEEEQEPEKEDEVADSQEENDQTDDEAVVIKTKASKKKEQDKDKDNDNDPSDVDEAVEGKKDAKDTKRKVVKSADKKKKVEEVEEPTDKKAPGKKVVKAAEPKTAESKATEPKTETKGKKTTAVGTKGKK